MASQLPGGALWGGPKFGAGAGTPVQTVINGALRIAGITLRPMRTPSGDQYGEALPLLNAMIGQWNTQSLMIFTRSIAAYPLIPNQKTYTIGGPGLGATFDAARPQMIEEANLILNTVTPVVRMPLTIWNDEEWSKIRVQDIANSLPLGIYNDGAFPLSTIYVFPQPLNPYLLELFTWSQIATFATITDLVVLPPGYQMAMEYNLAIVLAEHYPHESRVIPSVYQQAAKSLAKVKALNSEPNKQISDVIGLDGRNRPTFNYRTGQVQ